MAEVQHGHTNGGSDTAHAKKRKGFWSNLMNKSSNAPEGEHKTASPTDVNGECKEGQEPKKGGFMNTFMDSARQVAIKTVEQVAQDEAKKEIEKTLHGSQPSNTNNGTATSSTSAATQTASTTTNPNDVVSSTSNWAKRMVDSAQQKIQNLQNNMGA